MTVPLKVLLIENSEEDAALIHFTLEQADFDVDKVCVETIDQLKDALAKGGWDVVIADDNLPNLNPAAALRLVKSTGDDIPFIIVSSKVDEEAAIELMRTGAADYILKDKLARLALIVQREQFEVLTRHERRETEIALVEANRRLRTLFEQSPFGVVIIDPVSLLPIDFNTIAHLQLGYSREEFSQLRIYDYEVNKKPTEIARFIASTIKLGKEQFDSYHKTKNGEIRNIQITAQSLALIDRTVIHCIYQDITERKKAEKALTESEAAFQDIFQTVNDGIAYTTLSGEVISVNKALTDLIGTPEEEIVGRNIVNIAKKLLSLKMAARVVPKLINMIKGEDIESFEVDYQDKILEINSLYNKKSRHITGIIRDITERKKAEKVLQESETRLQAMVTNIPDVIAIMQPDGEITYKSPNIEKWFGWKPSDLMGKNGWQTVHPDDLVRVQAIFQKLLKQYGNTDTIEYRYKCKDGSIRLVHLTATNLINDPVINGILLNYHDVTAQRKAESEQRATEAKFRKAFDTSPDSININRLQDGLFLDINEGFISLTGYTWEDVTGKTSLEINIWDNPEDRTRLVKGLRENGKVVNLEAPFRMKDGSIKTCLMSANIIEVEGVTCILSITRDITDRRKMELDIALAEEKFRKAFDTSPDCIIITRMHDGMYMDINNGFIELTGYTRDDVIGRKSAEINIWANPEDMEHMKSEMREQGRVVNMETQLRIKDGSIKTCLMSANVIEVNGENCILSLTRDITERKHSEEAIQLQSAALNAVANAVVISDVNHTITWANPAFYALSGYSKEEAVGQQMSSLVRSNVHDPSFYTDHFDIVNSGKTWQGEIINRRKNGELYPEELTVTPLMDKDGRITNYIAVKQDISEKKLNSDIMNSRLHLLEFSVNHSLLELLKETLHEVENLTGSLVSFYHFLDADQQTINLHVWSNQTEQTYCSTNTSDLHFSVENSSMWIDCIRERRAVIHNDYNALPNKKVLPEGHIELTREMVIPVFRNNQAVALLGVGNKTGEYSRKDEEIVTRLADLTWDMAEKKKSEQALRESELHYREIVTDLDKAQFYAHLGSWTWDIKNNQLTWSDELFRIFGLNRSTFSGKIEDYINNTIHPEDQQKVRDTNISISAGITPIPLEYRIIRPDHTVRTVWAEAGELINDDQGKPVKLSGIIQDITERKIIEERVEAERQLLHLCNQAEDLKTLGASITFYLKELTKCEAVGMRLQQGDDFPYYESFGFPSSFIEKENFLCSYSSQGEIKRDSTGNIVLECLCGNILQSRLDLNSSSYTPNGSFWTNSTTEFVSRLKDKKQNTFYRNRCNNEGYESVALIPIRLNSKTFGLFQFNDKRPNRFTPIQIELLEHLANFVAIALAKLESDDALIKSEKRYKDLFEHSALPNLEEDFSEISKIFTDLRQQGVSDMRKYFEGQPEVVTHCARLIKILDVNQACVDFFKVNNKEELFTQLPKFFTDTSWPVFREEIIALAEGKKRFECDISARTKTNEEKEIKLILSVDPEHSETLSRVMVSFIDVTESRKAQEALRESEERYHSLIEAAPTGIFVMVKGIYAYANPAGLDILGYTRLEDFIGTKAEKIIHPDSFPTVMKRLASDILFKSNSPLELKVLKKNGETVYTESISTPVKFNGKPAVLILSHDISDRIKAEAALRESESRFRSLFQNVKSVAVQGYASDGTTLYWNEASEKLYGYSQQEAIGKKLTDLIIPPDMRSEVEKAIEWMSESREPIPSSELTLMRKDGSRVDVFSSHALVGRPDQPLELFCIDVDLTERKTMELALQASLDEKEVLLREVHHRVKNNLASILGLLEMERQSTTDPNADNLLMELGNRIKSMATIHEKLYRSPSLAKIDFQDYLKSFISHLRTSMQPGGEIDTRVKASNVDLSLDLAVPCGLIVNELVTNALKYGFPEGKPGVKGADKCEISVSMAVKGSAYTLQVADNGVGIPEDLDWRNAKSLGLRLITMLGEHQLGGKITLDRKNGTKFTLKFDPRHRE